MDQSAEARTRAFEARLRRLRDQATRAFSTRADELRKCVQELSRDETALEALERHLHRLHGIAGTYGHLQLSETAARLEGELRNLPLAEAMNQTLQLAELMEQTARQVCVDTPSTDQDSSHPPAGTGEPLEDP